MGLFARFCGMGAWLEWVRQDPIRSRSWLCRCNRRPGERGLRGHMRRCNNLKKRMMRKFWGKKAFWFFSSHRISIIHQLKITRARDKLKTKSHQGHESVFPWHWFDMTRCAGWHGWMINCTEAAHLDSRCLKTRSDRCWSFRLLQPRIRLLSSWLLFPVFGVENFN